MRLYHYVGPRHLADRATSGSPGTPICCAQDVLDWTQDTRQEPAGGCVIATFVVDSSGLLLLADRCSEHVACAGGQPVLAAGEITFAITCRVEIVAVSNQSTGYCPEPESWPVVAEALRRAGLVIPDGFSFVCVFRRCPECGGINIVKDGVFECAVCSCELPERCNVQDDVS